MNKFVFKIHIKDKGSKARVGQLRTPHGLIDTPNFVAVGTQGTVKSLSPEDLQEIGSQIILANTYHLHLRPGEDVVEKLGGLGRFMNWGGPTMTDSGGFQVFSLGAAQVGSAGQNKLSKFSQQEDSFIRQAQKAISKIKPAKVDEEGVTFYSHLDGSKQQLDPENSIAMQEKLGADLIVAFDDHESPLWNYEEIKKSLDRTHRWALQSRVAHKRKDQLMYGVTHGGMYQDLRVESAKFINKHFDAIGIGGVYGSKEMLYKVIDWTVPFLSDDKPRHLLGIGEVADVFEAVERGMDLFDCAAPTRRARHGNIYISPQNGSAEQNLIIKQNLTIQITNAEYALDAKPLDPGCLCYACQNFTRAYMHHLFRAKELLGYRLATYHNVYFIVDLMRKMREAIKNNQFKQLKMRWA